MKKYEKMSIEELVQAKDRLSKKREAFCLICALVEALTVVCNLFVVCTFKDQFSAEFMSCLLCLNLGILTIGLVVFDRKRDEIKTQLMCETARRNLNPQSYPGR